MVLCRGLAARSKRKREAARMVLCRGLAARSKRKREAARMVLCRGLAAAGCHVPTQKLLRSAAGADEP